MAKANNKVEKKIDSENDNELYFKMRINEDNLFSCKNCDKKCDNEKGMRQHISKKHKQLDLNSSRKRKLSFQEDNHEASDENDSKDTNTKKAKMNRKN